MHIAGDRRDHFETSTHVWELLRTIVRERQRREIAPTIEVLRELLADPAISKDPADAKLRIRETLELLETLTAWSDEMLRLDTETLTKVLKLGAKIKKLLGGECEGRAARGRRHSAWRRPARALSSKLFCPSISVLTEITGGNMNTIYPLTLLYDGAVPGLLAGDGPPARARSRDGRLVFVDIAAPGFDPAPYGVTRVALDAADPRPCADGRMLRGMPVLRLAYAAAGLGWAAGAHRLAAAAPAVRRRLPPVRAAPAGASRAPRAADRRPARLRARRTRAPHGGLPRAALAASLHSEGGRHESARLRQPPAASAGAVVRALRSRGHAVIEARARRTPTAAHTLHVDYMQPVAPADWARAPARPRASTPWSTASAS